MTQRTIIKGKELKSLLNKFSNQVADKKYEKFAYTTWRDISRVNDGDTILLDKVSDYSSYGDESLSIRVRIDGTHNAWHFHPDDNSFGEFLIENWPRDSYYEYDGYCEKKSTSDYYNPYKLSDQKVIPSYGYATVTSLADTKEDTLSTKLSTKADKAELADLEVRLQELSKIVNENTTTNNEKENSIMKGFNFDFGPVNANVVRMSMYGLAVRNKTGTYVSYDAKNGEIMDVDIFNFDGAKFIWKMPVAIKDIAVGDVVVHQNVPMFVVAIPEGGKVLTAVDPVAGERKDIMLARSPFGFNFATKVVNLLGDTFNGNGTASAENPFGNMWMLFALSDENADMKEMLPFMLMANGGMNTMNPMMFYCLMGKDNVDPMALAMMMGAFNPAPAATCNCGGNCGNH